MGIENDVPTIHELSDRVNDLEQALEKTHTALIKAQRTLEAHGNPFNRNQKSMSYLQTAQLIAQPIPTHRLLRTMAKRRSVTLRFTETREHTFELDDVPRHVDIEDPKAVFDWADENELLSFLDGDQVDQPTYEILD